MMDWNLVIGAVTSVGTGLTALYTAQAAGQAKRSVEEGMRPILIITPELHGIESVNNPTIHIKNYGKGPAILQEINFYGLQFNNEEGGLVPSGKPRAYQTEQDIVPPSAENSYKLQQLNDVFFGRTEGTKFTVRYKDFRGGSVYVHTCAWVLGQWQRTETVEREK